MATIKPSERQLDRDRIAALKAVARRIDADNAHASPTFDTLRRYALAMGIAVRLLIRLGSQEAGRSADGGTMSFLAHCGRIINACRWPGTSSVLELRLKAFS